MARMFRTLLVLLTLAAPASAVAATWTTDGLDDFWITRWDRTGGGSGLIVALAQDRDGYLWMGSGDGLFRFDGFSFQRWPELSDKPLAGTSVRTLFLDRGGLLWVGFDEGGVSRIRGTEVRNYGPADGLPTTSVRAVVQDGDGAIWVASLGGLFRLRDERWSPPSNTRGLPAGPALSAMFDATGSLFVSTRDAVFRRRAGSTTFETIATQPVGPGSSQSLCKDAEGHVVASDPVHGFRILGDSPAPALPAPSGIGMKVFCARNGTIWIGTRLTGLWRISPDPRDPAVPAVRTNLLSQAALAVMEDRDQNVWVATNAGLYRLTPRNVRTLSVPAVPTTATPDHAGHMWIGTIDGLYQFSRRGDSWQRTAAFLSGAQVLSVHADASDAIWVSTVAGVSRIAPGQEPVAPSWGNTLQQVTSITSSANGTLWLYDERQGLYRVRGSRIEPLELAGDLKGVATTVLHADRRNRLWLVSERGVEIRGDDGDIRRYTKADGLDDASYRSIYEDQAGVIWLGSTLGLSRVSEGRIEGIAIPGVRRTAWVKTIVEDRQGQLWLGIDRGGVRLSRASFQNALRTPRRALAEGFDVFDGLPGTIRAISDRVATRTPTGQLWFTTDEGIAIVDPDTSMPDRGVVPARISALKADDITVDPTAAARLRAGTRRLQVTWTALELTTPDRVHFRYRLDGRDREWIDAGSQRDAEYTNLEPGSYVFRVAAAREGEAWRDASGTSVEFSVAPHVYQTAWFPFLVAGLLAAASWGMWYTRLSQVRRRFTITLAERARVSREVHDTLLQSLVGVALQCQVLADSVEVPSVKDRLVRLRGRIDDHVDEARELIWNLRSPTLERSDLRTALQRMADEIADGTAVRVECRASGPARSCPPQVERELLRIGQEAVSNAVRHGRATRVTIELQFEDRTVRLRVTDDGCGFTPEQTLALADRHCGLAMMRERAEQIGGRLFIASRPAEGACIEATAPLTPAPAR
jgi:signal transduction histidine kinase/ligand-binding sensor domain-containing protein